LFVREREREAAQTAWFWLDRNAGFAWRSHNTLPSKSRRALILMLALGVVLTRAGERIGALGYASRAGANAPDHVANDLLAPLHDAPPPPHSFLIFASDFYAPIESWRTRLQAAADAGARGLLLNVSDPEEENFPFSGRTRFRAPGKQAETVIGKAESARETYLHRLAAQREAVRELGNQFGFPALSHRTDHAPGLAFAQLIAAAEAPRA
jgi:uncharacterized protein (DUF58 family)